MAGLFGLFALLVFLQYYFDVILDEIAFASLLLVIAWMLLIYPDDGTRWIRFTFAGLLVLLAAAPFWRGYRKRSSGKREKSIADKPLYFYSWLMLIFVLTAIGLLTR